MARTPSRIDPNRIKTRDPLMVKLINGATKAGYHRRQEIEPTTEHTCRQCFHEYTPRSQDDGFCSDECMRQYDMELKGEVDGTT